VERSLAGKSLIRNATCWTILEHIVGKSHSHAKFAKKVSSKRPNFISTTQCMEALPKTLLERMKIF
jgi:hypothetical protein